MAPTITAATTAPATVTSAIPATAVCAVASARHVRGTDAATTSVISARANTSTRTVLRLGLFGH
ncbi:hypothetical protein SCANM63S_04818 [Streptomyces canarius]